MVEPIILRYLTTTILATMKECTDEIPLIHRAALAALLHFRTVGVPAAINGDLAWYLLQASRHTRWHLDIHIEGDWETLLSATNSLAHANRRFRIDTTDYPKYTLLVYTNDVQNPTGIDLIDEEPPNINEPPSQRRVDYCKVFFNCGLVGTHNFFLVQPGDIALLPFQLLLQRRMHGYTSPRVIESHETRKGRMHQDVAAIKAYLAKDPKREPWFIHSNQRRPFLQFLTDICTALPHAISVAQYLALLPPGYAHLSSAPQAPLFDAYLPLTKIPIAARRVPDVLYSSLHLHQAKEQSKLRKAMVQSQLLKAAIHDLPICIRALGYACYLTGPGDVPWYVLGYSKLPLDSRIHFLVIPVHEGSDVADLRRQLCKEGLLAKRSGGGYIFAKCIEHAPWCRVTIEQVDPRPDVEMGVTMDGIPVYSPSHLVFAELSECVKLADKPMKKDFEGGRKDNQLLRIIPAIRAFARAKMDLRSVVVDVEKREVFDRLVMDLCASHPGLMEDFAAIGFREVLGKRVSQSNDAVDALGP
ncbi:uncharacterized protein EV420DRAFT_1547068 [Desarmillaria tabescens]|uniref:Uncharacterized protein n=1 Tax=Armillaria tabescens TaxID=1929756 RepID=A0AA39KD96_ARMTA|nr:uncharacterized protein EV420DRAFT_1547068 [Desarmillaria tabescens]KAK0457736.1 hypothetical protein EV420DRAFT_1547068 [Desarmillaria tabescens]